MRKKLPLVLLLLLAALGCAQNVAELSDFSEGSFEPGSWRMYKSTGGGVLDGRGRYVAYLGTEVRDGEVYQWRESYGTGVSLRLVSRELVPHEEPWKPRLVSVVQREGFPAQTTSLAPPARQTSLWAKATDVRIVSAEPVTVLAGTFLADVINYQRRGITYRDYLSRDEPRGLILSESPSYRLELVAWGVDGKTVIVEVPLPEQSGQEGILRSFGVAQDPPVLSQDEEARWQWRYCVQDHAIRLPWYRGTRFEEVWDLALERCSDIESERVIWTLSETRDDWLNDVKDYVRELWRKTGTAEVNEESCRTKPGWLSLQRCQELVDQP